MVKVLSTKYYKLKIVVCSVALWSDVHRRHIWWIMIQTGERWCSLYLDFRLMCLYSEVDVNVNTFV